MNPIQIDAYVDTTCPYCYIGKRQLDNALAKRPDAAIQITWRVLQLSPDAPIEGRDYHQRMTDIIGSVERKNAAFERLTEYGKQVGLTLNFDKIERMPNTLHSLCLISWSEPGTQQDQIVEALFKACFSDGQFLGDDQILDAIAKAHGLTDFLTRINNATEIDAVKTAIQQSQQLGLGGVPAFVFNQQYLISGAQDESAFIQLIDKLTA